MYREEQNRHGLIWIGKHWEITVGQSRVQFPHKSVLNILDHLLDVPCMFSFLGIYTPSLIVITMSPSHLWWGGQYPKLCNPCDTC